MVDVMILVLTDALLVLLSVDLDVEKVVLELV